MIFTDGLYTFNYDELEHYYTDIYPDGIELKKKNKDLCKSPFLDLSIEITDRKFTANLFGERIAFPFILYLNMIC